MQQQIGALTTLPVKQKEIICEQKILPNALLWFSLMSVNEELIKILSRHIAPEKPKRSRYHEVHKSPSKSIHHNHSSRWIVLIHAQA